MEKLFEPLIIEGESMCLNNNALYMKIKHGKLFTNAEKINLKHKKISELIAQ